MASPVYKQRFDLRTGQCLDDPAVVVATVPRAGRRRPRAWCGHAVKLLSAVDAGRASRPIDRYLAEQADLTAVERFAQHHEADPCPRRPATTAT